MLTVKSQNISPLLFYIIPLLCAITFDLWLIMMDDETRFKYVGGLMSVVPSSVSEVSLTPSKDNGDQHLTELKTEASYMYLRSDH